MLRFWLSYRMGQTFKTSVLTKNTRLVITWIPDCYDMFKFKIKQISMGFSYFSRDEKDVNNVNLTLTIMDRVEKSKLVVYKAYKSKMSWNEASERFKEIGGYLPYFTSRQDLEQLLALLKFHYDIPLMMFMFIGLKSNLNPVS